jgi:hypothetical protein
MKTCPKCGQEVWDKAPCCTKCGEWLAAEREGSLPPPTPPPGAGPIPQPIPGAQSANPAPIDHTSAKKSDLIRAIRWGFGLGCGYTLFSFCLFLIAIGCLALFGVLLAFGGKDASKSPSLQMNDILKPASPPARQFSPPFRPTGTTTSRPPILKSPKTNNLPSRDPQHADPPRPVVRKPLPPLADPVSAYVQQHSDYGEVLDAEPAETDRQSVTFRVGRYLFKFQEGRVTGIRKE